MAQAAPSAGVRPAGVSEAKPKHSEAAARLVHRQEEVRELWRRPKNAVPVTGAAGHVVMRQNAAGVKRRAQLTRQARPGWRGLEAQRKALARWAQAARQPTDPRAVLKVEARAARPAPKNGVDR